MHQPQARTCIYLHGAGEPPPVLNRRTAVLTGLGVAEARRVPLQHHQRRGLLHALRPARPQVRVLLGTEPYWCRASYHVPATTHKAVPATRPTPGERESLSVRHCGGSRLSLAVMILYLSRDSYLMDPRPRPSPIIYHTGGFDHRMR